MPKQTSEQISDELLLFLDKLAVILAHAPRELKEKLRRGEITVDEAYWEVVEQNFWRADGVTIIIAPKEVG